MTDLLPLPEIERRLRERFARLTYDVLLPSSSRLPWEKASNLKSERYGVGTETTREAYAVGTTLAREVARMLEETTADLTAERNATVAQAIARAQIAGEEALASRRDIRALCERRDALEDRCTDLETREQRMLEEQREADALAVCAQCREALNREGPVVEQRNGLWVHAHGEWDWRSCDAAAIRSQR